MAKHTLGQMIRARRKKLGLTAEKLAIKSGIDRTYLSKIERHGYLPSPNVLLKIVNNREVLKFFPFYIKKQIFC